MTAYTQGSSFEGPGSNDDDAISADVQLAREAVAQMFGANKTDMTELEVNLWRYEIDRMGSEPMLRFVRFWTSGGGQGNFMRAPRIDDFKRRMDPDFVGVEDALELLRREVVRVGPYASPTISNVKLHVAVLSLGGWAKVCLDMPDARQEFDSKRFAERFKFAWAQGEAAELQGRLPVEPLLGLVSAPKQLIFIASNTQAHDAQHSEASSPGVSFQP